MIEAASLRVVGLFGCAEAFDEARADEEVFAVLVESDDDEDSDDARLDNLAVIRTMMLL